MPQSHRAARAGPPFSVGFPGAWAHVYPSRDVWGQESRAFPPMAQFPSNHLGPEGGTRSGFPGTPLAAAVLLALRMGGAEESPFPGCFWVGVSNEVPGGALNLPQECRRVHMPTFSTLFSMHRHRQAEEKRRAPFSQKGILFSGLNPVGDTKVPVWVGPPQTQHVEHRACDSTSFQPRMG